MIGKYELVLVVDADLEDSAIQAEIGKIEEIIKSHSGEIETRDEWGKRQLSYKINKKEYGYYVLFVFSAEGTVVTEIDRFIAINETYLRHLTVKKDKHAPDLSAQLKEEIDLPDFQQTEPY